MLAQYLADALRTGLSHGPAEVADRAETLTELLEVGITSGWDDVPVQGGDVAAVGGEIAYVHPGVIDRHSSAELITQLQGRLSDLASSTNNTHLDPGPVDGLWGPLTAAGLRGFQEEQLELLNTALDVLDDLPEYHYLPFIEQRNDLLVDINLSRAGSVSGVLLTEPLTAIDMNTLVGQIREGSSILPENATASELALFIEQSLNASEDGFIMVDSNSGQLGGFMAQRIRVVIEHIKEHPELLRETVGRLNSSTLQLWADGVNSLLPSEVDEFVGLIATQLSAYQLNV